MNKKIINAILILIGVAAVYCTYQFYYTKNQEVIEQLQLDCKEIQSKIDSLEILIAQEPTYSDTIEKVQQDIAKKAKEFAKTNEVPDEDVIMYAVNMEKEYVGDADTKTQIEELGNDAFVKPEKITLKDREAAAEEDENAKFNPFKDSKLLIREIDFVDTASIANFSASFTGKYPVEMNFSLYQTSPVYAFSTNYGGMSYIIDKMVSDEGTKRVLDFIDMKYNRLNGELVGTVGYSIYTMDHENSMKYEPLELDEVEEGPENIYGGLLKERKEKEDEENTNPLP